MTHRNSLIIALWIALLGAALLYLRNGPPLRTDISQFLPQSHDPRQAVLLNQLRNSGAARLIMLAISGAQPQTLAKTSRALRTALADNALFDRVDNGSSGLKPEALARLRRYRYLLSDQDYSVAALRQALLKRLQELNSPLGLIIKTTIPADPTAATRAYLQGLADSPRPRQRFGVWFNPSMDQALLVLQIHGHAMDLNLQQQAHAAILSAWREIKPKAAMALHISGTGTLALQSRDLIRNEANRLSIWASLGVMLVLLLSYRSPRLLVVAALPLVTGILAGATAVTALLGELHGITLAFGITLLGVAVDYPVHLISHAQRQNDTRRALASIWPILCLSMATTSLGFAALLFSGFPGLAQLGLFAITGLLSAGAVTLWVIPIIHPHPGMEPSAPRGNNGVRRLPRGMGAIPLLLMVPALLILAKSGGQLWQDDPALLSPIPAAERDLDRQMRADLGVPDLRYVITVDGPDRESVLQRCEALAPLLDQEVKRGLLRTYHSPSSELPSVATQQRRAAQIPDPQQMRQRLQAATKGLPFRPEEFAPFLEDLEASRHLAPLRPQQLGGSLAGQRLANTLLATNVGYSAIISLSGVSNPTALAQQLVQAPSHDVLHLVDLRTETRRIVRQYRQEALHLLLWGGLAMALLLWLSLRNLREVGRVLLPVTAALTVTAAMLTLQGQALNLFHLCALMLVLGLGIDYALFFRHAAGQVKGRDTYKALVVCNITTLLVFVLLAGTRIPVLHAIGSTVAIGAALSLIFSFLMTHNTGRSTLPLKNQSIR